ncbi:MAG: hypothetical protein FWF79_08080 [Defluviitaleaceae bacterium]|nr:hypothetical protein [Defluviitaleaceae bacterium]
MKIKTPEMERATNLDKMARAFAPEPLKGKDFIKFYCHNTMEARLGKGEECNSPLNKLLESCTTPSSSNAHLLLGHKGCGKSTELNNLKQELEKKGYTVCVTDCRWDLDLLKVTCWDIMLLITEGLCKIASENKIKIPTKQLEEALSYLKEDKELVKSSEKEATLEAGVGAKAGSALGGILGAFASLRAESKLSNKTREITSERLEYLILKTGGSLRHLFECIINAANRAKFNDAEIIRLEDAKSALDGIKRELTRQITTDDYERLAKIYTHEKYRERIEDKEFHLRMTQTSVLFEYQNGSRWHDVHPLIAEFLIKQKEIENER